MLVFYLASQRYGMFWFVGGQGRWGWGSRYSLHSHETNAQRKQRCWLSRQQDHSGDNYCTDESVTIDDIDVVIDSGLERRSEVRNGVEGLFIAQISQADCLQRAGRAGHCKETWRNISWLRMIRCHVWVWRATTICDTRDFTEAHWSAVDAYG